MIGYHVNNRLFSNGLEASDHAARYSPHETVKFVFDDDFWSQQDWSKEPDESFDLLLDTRARQVREKYGYLVLLFSGGTDSMQIYNVFKRNNIRIDELMILYSNTDTYLDRAIPVDVVDWAVRYHWDPKTKITAVPKLHDDLQTANEIYRPQISSWISQPFITSNSADTWIYERILTDNESKSPGLVIGLEKPTLIYKNDAWWVTYLDKTFRPYLPKIPQMEWFYICPDFPKLHIKQCFLLLQAAKHQKPPASDYWSTSFWANDDYDAFCWATGRQGELIPGASEANKNWYKSDNQDSLESQIITNHHPTRLSRLVEQLAPQFLEWKREHRFYQDLRLYMQRQKLYNDTDFDWNGIYSTMIKIGHHA